MVEKIFGRTKKLIQKKLVEKQKLVENLFGENFHNN